MKRAGEQELRGDVVGRDGRLFGARSARLRLHVETRRALSPPPRRRRWLQPTAVPFIAPARALQRLTAALVAASLLPPLQARALIFASVGLGARCTLLGTGPRMRSSLSPVALGNVVRAHGAT